MNEKYGFALVSRSHCLYDQQYIIRTMGSKIDFDVVMFRHTYAGVVYRQLLHCRVTSRHWPDSRLEEAVSIIETLRHVLKYTS